MSVEQLANLEPEVVATGHGRPMRGEIMRKSLYNLVRDFDKVAIPSQGRYVHQPALMDDSGVVHIPPKNKNSSSYPTLKFLGIISGALITMLLLKKDKKDKKPKDSPKAKKIADRKVDKSTVGDTVKSNWSKLKSSAGAEAKKWEKPAKKEWKNLQKTAKHGLKELKEEIKSIKDPIQDKFDKLKFPVKKEIRRIKKLNF
ncbi:MAG: hypothetical protein WKF89_01795 [Chitinophagaceae bacterium]